MRTIVKDQIVGKLLVCVVGLGLQSAAMAQRVPVTDPPPGPPMRVRPGKQSCRSATASSGQVFSAAGISSSSPGDPIRCDQSLEFNGGFPEHAKFWQLPSSRGAFTLSYDFYSIPDKYPSYPG